MNDQPDPEQRFREKLPPMTERERRLTRRLYWSEYHLSDSELHPDD